jgi:subtilisin family serine protease
MTKLTVTVKRLNKRKIIPSILPDDNNIVGVVLQGFNFEGELVDVSQVPNPSMGSWYKDRDGHFYWGGGLEVTDGALAAFEVAEALPLPWWITQSGLDKIWDITKGENTKIAVLDTGYNRSITDLTEAVKDSKVFITSISGNPIPIDDKFGHGSHCASLIGGRNKNNITGCAPLSNLYIAKISSQGSVSSFKNIINAIQWAIEQKVDIISISYGGETNDADMEAAIKKAIQEHNIVVIAAIGDVITNGANLPCFPALLSDCLAVGATNKLNQIAPITVLSDKTEINAPGEQIPGYALTNTTELMKGTSQATAIVAGICALIISRHKSLGKNYTVSSIRNLILNAADPVVDHPNHKLINLGKIFQAI